MRPFLLWLALAFLLPTLPGQEMSASRIARTVVLDAPSEQNLRLQTAIAEESRWERTLFAVGRLETIPARESVVASRIPGRLVALHAQVGDRVEGGQVIAEVESRQSGPQPIRVPLHAPLGGTILAANAVLGQPVEPDQALFHLADLSELWAVAQVAEDDLASLAEPIVARVLVPATGDRWRTVTARGRVTVANRATGTVGLIFPLPDPDPRMLPGLRAEFALVQSSRPRVLSIPRAALQGDPARRVVFVRDFELPHAFVRLPVVVGDMNERRVEIISGLFPGDEVVTEGSYALQFAGAGSGPSLKEALDAAHGHAHNEDGSEMTGSPATGGGHDHGHDHDSHLGSRALMIYAVVMTLLALGLGQALWQRRRPEVAP